MIERKGTWPIFKYYINLGGLTSTVMIDDENGDLVICYGDNKFFGHWWNTPKGLRYFLTSVGTDYIEDKLSYNMERWCGDTAVKKLRELLEEKFGKDEDDWELETLEAFEEIDSSWSEQTFYTFLNHCEPLYGVYNPGEIDFGGLAANKSVTRFVDKMWNILVTQWKKELKSEEKAEAREAKSTKSKQRVGAAPTQRDEGEESQRGGQGIDPIVS